eukprot:CAMPEP_0170190682 /NCGR_PEP_ID=MMETSP0040_2-20121228/49877_1 /TAXON_ID=641309 /ORGANISM="Lotharella oceanica, Strain CCMP622" /LENGTH=192 /DNA_ID=CAMNT_0010438607 /DNA_START=18 /DNA_END=596 /DNA_ORIENTATION=-
MNKTLERGERRDQEMEGYAKSLQNLADKVRRVEGGFAHNDAEKDGGKEAATSDPDLTLRHFTTELHKALTLVRSHATVHNHTIAFKDALLGVLKKTFTELTDDPSPEISGASSDENLSQISENINKGASTSNETVALARNNQSTSNNGTTMRFVRNPLLPRTHNKKKNANKDQKVLLHELDGEFKDLLEVVG